MVAYRGFDIIKNGLLIGLFLQLAIGPVFFFIINLVLQKTIFDGIAGVFAVTIVDYLYITLAILGVGKILKKKKFKKMFGIISSIILMIFGFFIIKSAISNHLIDAVVISSESIISSFLSVFVITISSPLTIIFFTGIFTAKAVEYKYTKKQLYLFGFSVGSATFIFMLSSVFLFFFLKQTIPTEVIQFLNLIVGLILIVYGGIRILKNLKE